MADERLTSSLQITVLAALCFDKGHGAAIAAQVRPEHFDQAWREFAARVLKYRKQYGKPPENDAEDLADQVAAGSKTRDLLRKHLVPELFAERESLNAAYAASRVNDFIRRQTLKAAVVEASDKYAGGQDHESLVGDIETIFRKALLVKQSAFKAGTFLNDPNALRHMDAREDVIPLGIPMLDKMGIGLIPKQVILYIGPKGSGKTWFCIHCGKQSLLQGLRVVHYTLEMGEEEVIPRYYQAIFAASRTNEKYPRSLLEFDDMHRLSGFQTKMITPKLAFSDPGTKKVLRAKMKSFGTRFSGLVVKEFPTGLATIGDITSHLDYLEEVENFVPNIMIVDYPKLLKADRNNLRVDIGRNVEELRGLCVQRNLSGVFPHQGTRQTIGAKRVKSSQAGEDISVVQTADTILAFSRTQEEERRNLGRLSVEHARRARGGEVVLLSQSYDTGQYVLNSAPMQKAYWERMREVTGDDDLEE